MFIIATELGVAYVSITPSLKGFKGIVNKEFGAVEKAADNAGRESGSKFGDGFKAAGLLVAAAAGAAIGAAASVAIVSALDIEKGNDKLAAQLGLTAKESEAAGKIAGNLYAGAYGESMSEVQGAVGSVISSIEGMRTASAAEVEAMTGKVLDLSSAFEIDVTRATQVAGQMITSGLAEDGVEAADLLTAALQKVPAAVREDVLDAVDEYGPFFSQLGIEGSAAMGMLVASAEDGMYGIDKTGDAVKEFGIRATDMSKASGEAYELVGLSQEDMTAKLLAGGDTAAVAFQDIIRGVQGIEDPVAQSQAALALFGTPLEDLSVTEIPKFLESLTGASGGLGDVAGAASAMGDTLNDNASTKIESFKRTLETNVVNFMGEKVIPAIEGLWEKAQPVFQWLGETAHIWGPFAAGIGLVAGAFIAWSVGAWAVAAALGVITLPVTLTVAAIALLVGAVIWAYNNVGWFRDLIDTAFTFIKDVIANVVTWFTETAVPWFTTALDVLGTAFDWLWTNVIKPVFDLISWGVNVLWTIVNGVFQLMIAGLKFALGPAFQWFQDHVQPILDVVGQLIGNLWTKHVEPVFKWMADGVKALPAAFELAKAGIKTAWDKIKEIARGPVEFVINRVINDGLIGTFNKIPGVDIKRIPLPPGFANGGRIPGYSPSPTADNIPIMATANEFMVRQQSAMRLERKHPGALDYINKYGKIPGIDGYAKGGFIWPVDRRYPITQRPSSGHPAYDIGTPVGVPVRAAQAGRVALAGPGYRAPGVWGGTEAHIDHGGGVGSLYAHLSSLMVRVGEIVKQGQTIARSGNTGISSGPHLHFGGLNGSRMVSPDAYLNGSTPGGSYGGIAGGGPPANPFEGMVSTLMGAFREAFPAAGMFVDAAGGLAKSGIESVIKFVGDIAGNIGKFAGDIADNVVGGIKNFFGVGNADMSPLLHDQGGVLQPGLSTILNRTRKPEAILNQQQWSDISKLALSETRPSREIIIQGNVGWDPAEVARRIETQERRARVIEGALV